MNSLLLVVMVSCPPVAAYPDDDPAQDGSNQHRPMLFGWLRSHHRNKYASSGNGYAVSTSPPAVVTVQPGIAEAAPLQTAPTIASPPSCSCAGNRNASGTWPPVVAVPAPTVVPPVAAMPAPTIVPPPSTAGPAMRLVPVPQPATPSNQPPRAITPDGAPRQMPVGPAETTSAVPPRN
jgi:hypothetical protein